MKFTGLLAVVALAIATGGALLTPAQATAAEAVTIAARDEGFSELVTSIVQANLPHQYEKTKNWGATTEVWDGVHLSLDGLRVKTKRKRRTVNHGTWTKYHAELINPAEFDVQVANLRRLDDGRAAFDAEFFAPLRLFGRLSEWQLGVQLISVSASAEARVRLRITCAVETQLVRSSGYVPDVQFVPEITAAQVLLEDFRLLRLGTLHGPLAKELGEELDNVLQDELDDRNGQIVSKLNQQIARQREKGRLKLSLSDLADTKFGDLRAWVK